MTAPSVSISTALGIAVVACSAPTAAPVAPASPAGHYASIGPLRMYYELHGAGPPVVLVHGGGSTIQTSFGRLLPVLAATRRVIAVELQAHGRTADVDRPLSFAQDADDIAALLDQLAVPRADVIGFSNGATTAIQLAIRHPRLVRSIVPISGVISADGMVRELRDSFQREPSLDQMPAVLREAYRAVAPRPDDLSIMMAKATRRMRELTAIPLDAIRAIAAPALVITGDRDVALPEHSVEMYRAFRCGELAVLPHIDHMQIMDRADLLLPLISAFLDREPCEPAR